MPMYVYRHSYGYGKKCAPEFEAFQRMAEDAYLKCPTCRKLVQRMIQACAVKVKNAPESPKKSVERVTGEKRKHFDCPWPNAKTKQCERVYLEGSKAEQKAAVQDAVLRTNYAKKRKLSRADISPTNL